MSATQTSWWAGCAARLHILTGEAYPFLVMLAQDPANAVPEALTRPGSTGAVLTHDASRSWPDRKGEALARAMLDGGGTVALAFARLADALGAQARLRGPQ